MTTRTGHLFFLFCVISISACRKSDGFVDPPVDKNTIIGTWRFVDINATIDDTLLSGLFSPIYKSVVHVTFNSENNRGTVEVTGKNFIFNDIAYTNVFQDQSYTYLDDKLIDSSFQTTRDSVTPYNATLDYNRIDSDSITMSTNFVTQRSSNPVSYDTISSNYKFRLYQDTIFLREDFVTKTDNESQTAFQEIRLVRNR